MSARGLLIAQLFASCVTLAGIVLVWRVDRHLAIGITVLISGNNLEQALRLRRFPAPLSDPEGRE